MQVEKRGQEGEKIDLIPTVGQIWPSTCSATTTSYERPLVAGHARAAVMTPSVVRGRSEGG